MIPPVDKRIEDTSAFIVRAKKHIAAESLKNEQAEKQRQVFEEELARRGIWNVSNLRARLHKQMGQDHAGRSRRTQWRTVWAKRETAVSQERRGGFPAMPTLVPPELNMWLEERHTDLRDALSRDSNRALELTAKLSEGVEQVVEMTDGMHP